MARRRDDDVVECRLLCECRARCTLSLPADEPARAVLERLSCPTCGRLGRMQITRMEVEPEEPPSSGGRLAQPPEIACVNGSDNLGPDVEGDEYLRDHRARFWKA
jgi:hypothetical protein